MSIEFKSLCKSFDGSRVLEDVSLAVEPGEVLFVIGTSGTGKSVLMRHVIGLHRPDSGEVWVHGQRVDLLSERELFEIRKRCGFVFQHPALLDFLSLEENVAMPLRRRFGLGRKDATERAVSWLSQVGITKDARSLPSEVGPGIRKRASIARVVALGPEYIVYDEPTTGLDLVNARRIDNLIRRLATETKVTTVVVSHDLRSIFGIADRVAFLYLGRLHALGSPEELRESNDPILSQFLRGRAEGPMVL